MAPRHSILEAFTDTIIHGWITREQETSGETSKTGRQKQLNSLAAPEINVPLDIMSSNFEQWMKMATNNVCFEAHPQLTIFLIHPRRKSMQRTRGILC
jgi:hypothetical protein